MIIAIAISTMITMAVVVFALQYYSYKKNHGKQGRANASKVPAGRALETPITS